MSDMSERGNASKLLSSVTALVEEEVKFELADQLRTVNKRIKRLEGLTMSFRLLICDVMDKEIDE